MIKSLYKVTPNELSGLPPIQARFATPAEHLCRRATQISSGPKVSTFRCVAPFVENDSLGSATRQGEHRMWPKVLYTKADDAGREV